MSLGRFMFVAVRFNTQPFIDSLIYCFIVLFIAPYCKARIGITCNDQGAARILSLERHSAPGASFLGGVTVEFSRLHIRQIQTI